LRIAFLYNHDQVHQLPHSAPILAALAARPDAPELVALVGSPRLEKALRGWLGDAAARVRFVPLRPGLLTRAAMALLERWLPARKLLIYRDHLDLFKSFDALVMSEKTSLVLKTRYGLDVPMIHTRHGAGDRAIGYNRESAAFDLVLCSGRHVADRLVREAGVDPARIRVIGYPKFDLFPAEEPADRDALGLPGPRGRGAVLYNPHPAPALSSWYTHGNRIVAALRDAGWQTLFAPHLMLFERRIVMSAEFGTAAIVPPLDPALAADPLVHADLHGPGLADMRYARIADAYVGDASSQVYEVLRRPRPCVFVNSHGADWQGNPDYAHWQAGPVIDDPARLSDALDAAFAEHETRWKPVQQALFAERFDADPRPAGTRGAEAVIDYLAARK
jgi:hypothetical protein